MERRVNLDMDFTSDDAAKSRRRLPVFYVSAGVEKSALCCGGMKARKPALRRRAGLAA
jgi:hypothetical protein